MGLLSWVVFGFLAGLIARAVVPGTGKLGCLPTIAVGVVGAVIGGFAGEALFDDEIRYGWDLKPFLLSVLGAIVFLLLLQAVGGRRRRSL